MSAPTPGSQLLATSRLLGVQELFEKVLINMDMRTLLLAQRVDRHWKETINSSHELQVKLVFKPAADQDEAVHLCVEMDSIIDCSDNSYHVINPLLSNPGVEQMKIGSSLTRYDFTSNVIVSLEGSVSLSSSSRSMLLSQPPARWTWVVYPKASESEEPFRSRYERFQCDINAPDLPRSMTLGQHADHIEQMASKRGVPFAWEIENFTVTKEGYLTTTRNLFKERAILSAGSCPKDMLIHRAYTGAFDETFQTFDCGEMVDLPKEAYMVYPRKDTDGGWVSHMPDCCLQTRKRNLASQQPDGTPTSADEENEGGP